MYRVECSEGYEMYANRPIGKNEIIYTAELFLVDVSEETSVTEMSLQFYAYSLDDEEDMITFSPCILLNHSTDKPNVCFQLIQQEGKTVMEYRAKRDIQKDERLLVNYDA